MHIFFLCLRNPLVQLLECAKFIQEKPVQKSCKSVLERRERQEVQKKKTVLIYALEVFENRQHPSWKGYFWLISFHPVWTCWPFWPLVQKCLHCDKGHPQASYIWLIYLIWKSQSANYSGFVEKCNLFTLNLYSKCFWSCALLPFLNQYLSEYLILFSKSCINFRFCHKNTDLQILEWKLCKRKLAFFQSNPVLCT